MLKSFKCKTKKLMRLKLILNNLLTNLEELNIDQKVDTNKMWQKNFYSKNITL